MNNNPYLTTVKEIKKGCGTEVQSPFYRKRGFERSRRGKMNIIQAFEQLRKGNKIRINYWIDEAYLFLSKTGDVRIGWTDKKNTEIRDLIIQDVLSDNWEIFKETKEAVENKKSSIHSPQEVSNEGENK
jgi:hypothetical protein